MTPPCSCHMLGFIFYKKKNLVLTGFWEAWSKFIRFSPQKQLPFISHWSCSWLCKTTFGICSMCVKKTCTIFVFFFLSFYISFYTRDIYLSDVICLKLCSNMFTCPCLCNPLLFALFFFFWIIYFGSFLCSYAWSTTYTYGFKTRKHSSGFFRVC